MMQSACIRFVNEVSAGESFFLSPAPLKGEDRGRASRERNYRYAMDGTRVQYRDCPENIRSDNDHRGREGERNDSVMIRCDVGTERGAHSKRRRTHDDRRRERRLSHEAQD